MGVFGFLDAIANIVNKWTRTRQQKDRDELANLQLELSEAVFENDSIRISAIHKRMYDLRKKIADDINE